MKMTGYINLQLYVVKACNLDVNRVVRNSCFSGYAIVLGQNCRTHNKHRRFIDIWIFCTFKIKCRRFI